MGAIRAGGLALLLIPFAGCAPMVHGPRAMHPTATEGVPVSVRHETEAAGLRIAIDVPYLEVGRPATVRVSVADTGSGRSPSGRLVGLTVGPAQRGVSSLADGYRPEERPVDLFYREVGPGLYEATHTFRAAADVEVVATVLAGASTVSTQVTQAVHEPAGAKAAMGWPVVGGGLMVAMMLLKLAAW